MSLSLNETIHFRLMSALQSQNIDHNQRHQKIFGYLIRTGHSMTHSSLQFAFDWKRTLRCSTGILKLDEKKNGNRLKSECSSEFKLRFNQIYLCINVKDVY